MRCATSRQRARQMMGRNFDPAMFDNPEVRFAVLDSVINQHLLAGKARDERFRVSDAQLQRRSSRRFRRSRTAASSRRSATS